MKPILPKGIKPQLNKELNAYLKLDKEIKTLTSKKNELKLQLNAVLDEFGIDKLALSKGTLTIVKGSTRNTIADWDILIDKLKEYKIDVSLIVKQSRTKPSLRVTAHK
mgnify:FL=1|jgi:hypothetical protein|tara:strand:- start:53 stop:376 length:324 start_codon:yes stop_codon:yes gene_type:complete